MSVAFRRENDDEHKEPRFELPIPPGPNLVTRRGLALIEAKVAAFEAGEQNDENKRDLRYWRTRLATAEIAPPPDDEEVAFGSRVTLRMDGGERVLSIVGADEAEPAAGSLGFASPLARALIGAFAGDVVAFGGKSIEILATVPIDA